MIVSALIVYGPSMLVQEHLIQRVRQLCRADDRLHAALMYGSFAQGRGDEHSDIEFWLFFDRLDDVDQAGWCAQVGPVTHVTPNEFGAQVAFFPGLVRGEFHFAATAEIESVAGWPARGGASVDDMIVLDRSGRLAQALAEIPVEPVIGRTPYDIEVLTGRFANWLVLAHHVAARGELQRAVDALQHAQRHLLWLARLAHDATGSWLTPSRGFEAQLPADVVATLRALPGPADAASVTESLRRTWQAGRTLWVSLVRADRLPDGLIAELDNAVGP
jgi:lincosamide nucleotidyltransferase B/F